MIEGYSGSIQRALAHGEVDFGVLYAGQTPPGMAAERLLTEQLVLAGRQGERLLERFEVPLWEAAALPLVLPSRSHGLRQLIEREARGNGFALNVVLEIDALAPAKELCTMCGRPLGCKRKNEPGGRVDCDHVSGLFTRRHDEPVRNFVCEA